MDNKTKEPVKGGNLATEQVIKKVEEKEDFFIDFSKIPKDLKKGDNTNVRDTAPIEVKPKTGINDGAMSQDEMEKERQRRLKVIAKLTNENAHILDTIPTKLKCCVNPDSFCQEIYCKNWREIKGTMRCLHEYKMLKDSGLE